MKALIAAGLLSSGVVLAQTPPTGAPPSDRELHSAQCVAALQVQTETLAQQLKAGKEDLRPLLLSRLEAGAAFIGDAYLRGDRDEARARALKEQAIEDQKQLSPAQLSERQEACAAEGASLLAASNGLERFVVTRLAKKRMATLLGE